MSRKGYLLSVCVDFPDELIVAPFDRARMRIFLDFFRKLGVRRIYWIYTLKFEAGAFSPSAWLYLSENAERTFQAMGEFLPVAVQTAHELGMEIYAVYKHFDLGHNDTFPFNSPGARKYGKGLSSLSGEMFGGARFMAKYQAMRIARRTDDLPPGLEKRIIRKAVFTGRDDRPTRITPATLSIAVCNDNGTYRPYGEQYVFSDSVVDGKRTITLSGLNIRERYVSFQTPFRDNAPTLSNSYFPFLHLYDHEGVELPFTYGLVPRSKLHSENEHELPYGLWPEYPQEGFVFNRWDLRDPNHPLISLDNRHGALGIAKGKEMFVPGALSPAYPEVRALWLSHIAECLDAGVDGVDLREAQHNRSMNWEDYGYEEPVITEYCRRFGKVDGPAQMERDKQVEVMAGFMNEYYRQASRLIRARGKRVQMHVQPLTRRYMGIKWDWQTWIAEGLMDEITLKGAWPGDSATLDKMRDAARKGILLHSCPRVVEWNGKPPCDRLGEMMAAAESGGIENGCIIYETANIIQLFPDGRIRIVLPDIVKALQGRLHQ